MTNYVHFIISSKTNKQEHIIRDLKKYTSKQILKAIEDSNLESRKECLPRLHLGRGMLNLFAYARKTNSNNSTYQFWKQDYHPIELNTLEKTQQQVNYLHENPVRSGLVWEAWAYKYSSAIEYYTNSKGLLKLEIL
jgi:putative transposase